MRRLPSLTRDIRFCVVLKASPERVYQALTSARELCLWWLERAETEARNMGRLRMVWPGTKPGQGGEANGVFVDLEPGKKVAWIWDPRSIPRGIPGLVSFFLSPKGRGCDLTLLHAGFSSAASFNRRYLRCRQAWEDCLAKLKLYLESGRVCKGDRITLADGELLLKHPARAGLR